MRLLVRRVAARSAGRKVRRLSLHQACSLMEAAKGERFAHQGHPGWVGEHAGEYVHLYLISVSEMRLRSADVRCVVVLLDRNHRAVWMGLDVSPWRILSLRRPGDREFVQLIGWLSAGNPVVSGMVPYPHEM